MRLSYGHGMALVRIAFGLYFVVTAIGKLTSGWLSTPDPITTQYFTPMLPRSEPLYRPFLENVVVPNALLFSQLVAVAELAVGIAFTLGLLTKVAGLGGAFLNLNYMLMKGLANPGGSIDRLFFVAEIAFFLTAAGLVWGLDGWLRPYLPRWLSGAAPSEAAASPRDGLGEPVPSR
jgi:uncharacterized membrane protein YphA (DoxX/SURF4 family)